MPSMRTTRMRVGVGAIQRTQSGHGAAPAPAQSRQAVQSSLSVSSLCSLKGVGLCRSDWLHRRFEPNLLFDCSRAPSWKLDPNA